MTTTRPAPTTTAAVRRLPVRRVLLGTGTLALAGVLAACSGGTASVAASAAPSAAPSGAGAGAVGAGGAGQVPGTFGTIAAVSAGSLEVQNPTTGQVTVTYGATTTFSKTVTASLSAVATGDCVTASATPAAGSSASASASPPASPAARPTSFTATTVVVTQPTGGSCGTGFGGAGGAGGAGAAGGSGFPSGRPTGARTGGAGGFGGFGDRASGTVSAVAGDVITVAVPSRGSLAASTDTVTTTSTTTFTTTEAATSTDAVVGQCATAIGKADDTGTVAATRISLSAPGASGCTTGFGRRGGFGAGAAPTTTGA